MKPVSTIGILTFAMIGFLLATVGEIVSIQAGQLAESKISGEVVKATPKAVTIKDEKGKIHKLRLSKDTKVEGELKPGSKVEVTTVTTKVVRTDVKSISVKAAEAQPVQSTPEGQAAPVNQAPQQEAPAQK